MIRIVNTRLTIEDPVTHAKYYPSVISASTQQSHPFSISGATIDVVSNIPPNTSGYAAPIHFDDIVRFQVSIKYNNANRIVWQDLFHGRVESLSSTFGTSNQLKLYCSGHEAELEKDLIEETKSYPSSTDAKTLLSYYSKYFSRLKYSDLYADTGVTFPTYDSTKDQTFLLDLIGDMERNAGYDWAFKAVPTYDSNKNLSNVYAQWKPFSATPIPSYKIIEGTQRLISADFEIEGKEVISQQKIYGYNDTSKTPNIQYSGSYSDPVITSRYGKRSAVDTYDWIRSNDLCNKIAQGDQQGAKIPIPAGKVTLIGTPEAQIGDYVYVKIPSEELNGKSIEGYFYVMRVQHDVSNGIFHTTLDLGKIKKVAEDYISQAAKVARLCKCCLVRG